jgi:hypothetical protein
MAPLILTIQLTSLYMSLESVKSTNFDLMDILGLQPNSLCHTFVQGEWRAHQMGTRWKVQPGQRLLYRIYWLPLDACLDLDEELKRQPHYQMSLEKSLKRQGEAAVSLPSKAARKSFQATIRGAAFSSPSHQPPSKSSAMQPALISMPTQLNVLGMTLSPQSTSINSVSSCCDSVSPPPATLSGVTAFKLIKPNASTSKPPSISTPASSTDSAMELGPLKWPHEFFFSDIVGGLVLYDIKIKQGKHQQMAFFEIFGVPCVRQTLLNKRQLLDKIKQNNQELYDTYLLKGQVDEARWAHFESVVEGKPLRGKKRLDLLRSVTQNRRYIPLVRIIPLLIMCYC